MTHTDHSHAIPCQPGHQIAPGLQQGFGDRMLMLQPRHALAGGALRAAEAFLGNAPTGVRQGAWPGCDMPAHSLWVLETACQEAATWNDAPDPAPGCHRYAPAVMLSVDMPLSTLHDGRLLAHTRAALARTALPPFLLEIELPEAAVAHDATELLLDLSALRDLGVGLALDHFGSVSASLRLLQRLPLTAVKLDPCLIRDLVHDRETRATVAAAIGLAHALHTNVVATGVETAAQRDILADMGCDDAQGQMFGGMLPAASFRAALAPTVM